MRIPQVQSGRVWRVLWPVALLAVLLAGGARLSSRAADEEWRVAQPPYAFEAVRDRVSHPDYRVEWWRYHGRLTAKDGRTFGYQLKFIRVGVNFKPENPSRWAVRDLYLTQLAVTDVNGQQFRHAERINRAGVSWAGAEAERFYLWNEDWDATENATGEQVLRALADDCGLELTLASGGEPISHGADGVVQKGVLPVNATHFYSQTRLPTRGAITFNQQQFEVSGTSWLDHEFGTTFLENGQRGWDQLALQLDDGTDLLLYQSRNDDSPHGLESFATLTADSGNTTLAAEEFTLTPLTQWNSPASGAQYPVMWRAQSPGQNLDLTIRAVVAEQELRAGETTGLTVWSGLVEVSGTRQGRAVRGWGWLEMTGYAGGEMLLAN